tara:strand:+ start:1550 stop:3154 length:1605 start_codon:yes stop_codon:yes gene_type:complete
MARIPSYTQVAPTFQGIDMPQGAFNATGRAVAGIIQQVGGAVDTVKKFVDEAQNIRNQQDVRDTSREMRTMQAQFQEELVSNKIDPANWTSEWEKRLASFEGDLKNRSFPPVVANETKSQFKDFAGQSLISVSANALKENRRRATGSLEIDYNENIKNENFGLARKQIDDGLQLGLLDPVQAKAAHNEVNDKEETADMYLDANADPTNTLKEVLDGNYKTKLAPAQKIKFVDDLRRIISTKEKDAMRLVKQGLESGAFKTKEDLAKNLEDNFPDISDSTKKLVLFNFDNMKPIESEEKFLIIDPLIDAAKSFARGEISQEEYGKIHDETQSAVLALGQQRKGAGGLKTVLNNYDPAGFISMEGDVARDSIKKKLNSANDTGEALIKERVNALVDSTVAKKNLGVEIEVNKIKNKSEEKRKGILLRSRLEEDYRNFLTDPAEPNPTRVEIEEWINNKMPSAVIQIETEIKDASTQKGYMPSRSALILNGTKGETNPTGQVIPKGIPVSEAAKKIDEWLNIDNTASDLLLPPKPIR